jgi:hypothetical protein
MIRWKASSSSPGSSMLCSVIAASVRASGCPRAIRLTRAACTGPIPLAVSKAMASESASGVSSRVRKPPRQGICSHADSGASRQLKTTWTFNGKAGTKARRSQVSSRRNASTSSRISTTLPSLPSRQDASSHDAISPPAVRLSSRKKPRSVGSTNLQSMRTTVAPATRRRCANASRTRDFPMPPIPLTNVIDGSGAVATRSRNSSSSLRPTSGGSSWRASVAITLRRQAFSRQRGPSRPRSSGLARQSPSHRSRSRRF